MAKIKICGLRRTRDIEFVNELKPDFAGFIMTKRFRRYANGIETLLLLLSKDIKSVGVFVDEPVERVNSFGFDFVQLHGSESPEYCKKVKAPVIKMLKTEDFGRIPEYEPYVRYFLFDSGEGTGRVFDWSKIVKTKVPFFLAGGIDKNNIKTAVSEINPFAVDISSSVETDGVKDFDKIKEVIDIVRSIDNE